MMRRGLAYEGGQVATPEKGADHIRFGSQNGGDVRRVIRFSDALASLLGFKGGTAAYLFYDLPRFSTDLDFDLITSDIRIDSDIENIQRILGDLLKSDYTIKDHKVKANTLLWLIDYEKDAMNIKIEINTRKFPSSYESRSFYGNSIQLMKIGDMIAHKLVASMDRKSPADRDLFDIHFFLKSKYASEINYNIIKFRTGLEVREFYLKIYKYIDTYNKKNILNGLGEVLTESQKIDVKENLLGELKNLIQMQLDINN